MTVADASSPGSNGPTAAGTAPGGACPMCTSTATGPWKPGLPKVLCCAVCGGAWLAEPPARRDLTALYQEDYYAKGSGQRFLVLFDRALVALKTLRYRDIRSKVAGTGALLDIGCGRGELLEVFQRHGWSVLGTQLSATAAAAARGRGVEVRLGDLPELALDPARFQVITLFHVLEHLPEPERHLRCVAGLLAEDGLLVVEVPNFRTLGFRILGRRNLCFDHPHHLHFFSPRALQELLSRCGFRCGSRRFFSFEYSPFTTLQNLLNLLPGEPNLLYRSLMRAQGSRALRRRPAAWLQFGLAAILALPALLFASCGLVLATGNTLRIYCRKEPLGMDAPP